MLKIIFDTNIYGKLIEENKINSIREKILEDKEFIVYGFKPIKKELRDAPKNEKLGRLSKRNLLLALYNELTKGRYLKDSIEVNNLALKFYNSYRKFGGIRNWSKTNIDVDFTLVACASFYRLDIVISDDSKTLLSKSARKAYKHICVKDGFWQPNFWKYSDLKMKYNF
ncbi:hypothetical protein CL617_02970 [archaeon]|nr:hypothetical protein [archaeon]|tara:strand:- start:9796 stop:10302 length:507 start_codon:yes stop_codon:yes gene_type:complete